MLSVNGVRAERLAPRSCLRPQCRCSRCRRPRRSAFTAVASVAVALVPPSVDLPAARAVVSLAGDRRAGVGAGIAARGRSGARRRPARTGAAAGLRLGAPDSAANGRSWKVPRWLKVADGRLGHGAGDRRRLYALHGEPSVREQTTIGNARPVVDRAIVDVVAAAGAGPVVAVSGFDRVRSCKITPVRSGVEFRRDVTFTRHPVPNRRSCT